MIESRTNNEKSPLEFEPNGGGLTGDRVKLHFKIHCRIRVDEHDLTDYDCELSLGFESLEACES